MTEETERWAYQGVAEEFDGSEHLLSEATKVRRLPKREPKSSLAVRFDTADLERLRERAEADGVGITQLVRGWVLERLDEPADSAVSDLMAALEASLKAARAIKRSRPATSTKRAG
jgi:L-rhamnose isomerase